MQFLTSFLALLLSLRLSRGIGAPAQRRASYALILSAILYALKVYRPYIIDAWRTLLRSRGRTASVAWQVHVKLLKLRRFALLLHRSVASSAAAHVAGLQTVAAYQVEQVRISTTRAVMRRVDAAIDRAAANVCASVVDPDMPQPLRQLIHDTFKRITPEVKANLRLRAENIMYNPFARAQPHVLGHAHGTRDGGPALQRGGEEVPLAGTDARTQHAHVHAITSDVTLRNAAYEVGPASVPACRASAELGSDDAASSAQDLRRALPSRNSGGYTALAAEQRGITFKWRHVAHTVDALSHTVAAARAWILYALSPADASMWALYRRPSYWALQLIGFIPVAPLAYGWWLMLFLFKDKADEFQLADFIIGFEVSKFFSNGCFGLLLGALRYFVCTNFSEAYPCALYGPAMSTLDVLFFLLQVGLVFWAYATLASLPAAPAKRQSPAPREQALCTPAQNEAGTRSLPVAETLATPVGVSVRRLLTAVPTSAAWTRFASPILQRFQSQAVPTPDARAIAPSPRPSFIHATAKNYKRRGGALHTLFLYHAIVVMLCAVFASAALLMSSHVRHDGGSAASSIFLPSCLYWVRTIYGILSFPFLFFKLPLVTRLYVARSATGYDRAGHTVRVSSHAR
ncbi:hypothetical protein EON66_00705 [archaeon]|nr:MAG: hypothetical protein EON66_00705 [archaeon]